MTQVMLSGRKTIDQILAHKKEKKKILSSKLALNLKKPILAVILDNDLPPAALESLKTLLRGLQFIALQPVIIGDNPLSNLQYTRENRQLILEASDLALVFSFNDVEEILLNGIIPVSVKRPEITDYNPNSETGNSFLYKKNDTFAIFAALTRAAETYKFPYDWKHIVRQALKT